MPEVEEQTYEGALAEWLGQLEGLPDVHEHFTATCRSREMMGRRLFGDAYLTRDNISEAWEEAADLANYAFFEVLQRRDQGKDDRVDLALMAAHHAAMAHLTLLKLRDTP